MSGKVTTVTQAGLFIQRIGCRNDLEVALIQGVRDLDNGHAHRLALRSKGLTITKKQRNIALALTEGGEGIAIDCGLAGGNLGESLGADVYRLGRIGYVGAELGRIFLKRFQIGG